MPRAARPAIPERVLQAHGVHLLRSLGARVWVIGTTRRRGDYQGTMQSPGLPDVLTFLPPRESQVWRLLCWEVKRPGGRLRPEQLLFRELCQFAGIAHVVGDVDALIAWLVAERYLAPTQVPHYRVPRPGAPVGGPPTS